MPGKDKNPDQPLFSFKDPVPKPVEKAKPAAPANPAKPRVYTVSELNTMIKAALDTHLPSRITVTGELTDFRCHASGHCYFALKEATSQLPCVMWASSFKKLKFTPANGLAIVSTGHIDVYVAGGKYQFCAETMEPQGQGALRLAFEQMVARLEAQGLFAESHKKKLPPYPLRIAVLTSESGAALHDISSSFAHRWPIAKLFLYPVPVQGPGAAAAIAAAVTDCNRRNSLLKLDLLIVGRGGGSLEDLWAFNEEILAKAIYNSKIPIISAVGHEIDTTISDLVADARAATPTKAAVIAAPDINEVRDRFQAVQSRLHVNARRRLEGAQSSLATVLASSLFRNPLGPVLAATQQIDELAASLTAAVLARRANANAQLQRAYEKIIQIEPHRLLGSRKVTIAQCGARLQAALTSVIATSNVNLERNENRLKAAQNSHVSKSALHLTALENRLAGLDPRGVLNRGYSITCVKKTGAVISDPTQIKIGEMLVTEFCGKNYVESCVTANNNSSQ